MCVLDALNGTTSAQNAVAMNKYSRLSARILMRQSLWVHILLAATSTKISTASKTIKMYVGYDMSPSWDRTCAGTLHGIANAMNGI